ncbi:MAG TPA: hypothetical protein VH439_13620 [Gemmatimonadales bacterium]|jgi:hypothetical protein
MGPLRDKKLQSLRGPTVRELGENVDHYLEAQREVERAVEGQG